MISVPPNPRTADSPIKFPAAPTIDCLYTSFISGSYFFSNAPTPPAAKPPAIKPTPTFNGFSPPPISLVNTVFPPRPLLIDLDSSNVCIVSKEFW